MTVFSHEAFHDHEQVVFISDEAAGLKALIAIHDTTLGPALDGCRMYPYADEEAALRDVLRLSRGMTYKAAACGLDLGGGKAVIIGAPAARRRRRCSRRWAGRSSGSPDATSRPRMSARRWPISRRLGGRRAMSSACLSGSAAPETRPRPRRSASSMASPPPRATAGARRASRASMSQCRTSAMSAGTSASCCMRPAHR